MKIIYEKISKVKFDALWITHTTFECRTPNKWFKKVFMGVNWGELVIFAK